VVALKGVTRPQLLYSVLVFSNVIYKNNLLILPFLHLSLVFRVDLDFLLYWAKDSDERKVKVPCAAECASVARFVFAVQDLAAVDYFQG
jgi:hypothetical protein